MLAPTGVGFLWGRAALLAEMPPWQGGGEMIDTVSLEVVARSIASETQSPQLSSQRDERDVTDGLARGSAISRDDGSVRFGSGLASLEHEPRSSLRRGFACRGREDTTRVSRRRIPSALT